MGSDKSGITWFDDEVFIGMEVTFRETGNKRWRLERKISENEQLEDEEPSHRIRQADSRAVFVCSNLDRSDPKEAIMKIWMQIPYMSDWHINRLSKDRQATDTISSSADTEIDSLRTLMNARCSSTPTLIAYKQGRQDWENSWIPGGWIVYILMEKLPGVTPWNFWEFDREERDEIRKAFKDAWLECVRCGIRSLDEASRNVIWHKENKKCYIVDFDMGRPSRKKDVWRDSHWIGWNMASHEDGDLNDISTWGRL